ncbi:uncharacterized protein AMSG_02580 [Thecamonas trahens ATCC 50062]|uniref:E3 ubiquitin-protein ligase n=1 Tax=Thecamonas trahens ATCC 50062 TaxID=461836 RepID=A0A0L0D5T0_THETB|nr:hypothetical protein AMSG_02580 [Thecamonas trahens ATCC 50062]KNC47555.1 hypothetical protein AMSG_02580 [Thecamonas trahens ATCC 50062]|eukprot:XP_013759487.1 hypothetical protein AMSG_02580 [Thecamonas trahens ATCC 50062]
MAAVTEMLCGGEATELQNELAALASPMVCGKRWSTPSAAYKCKTCETDSSCIVCVECFQAGNHDGHDYYLIRTAGGVCDCGDATAWDPAGFCDVHRGQSEDDDPAAVLPLDVAAAGTAVLTAAISALVEHALNSSPRAIDILKWLLGVLEAFGDPLRRLSWVAATSAPAVDTPGLAKRAETPSGASLLDSLFSLEVSDGIAYPRIKPLLFDLYYEWIQDLKFKFVFAAALMPWYPPLADSHRRSGSECVLSLSIQILTIPAVALRVATENNAFAVILDNLTATLASAVDDSGPRAVIRPSASYFSEMQFLYTGLYDLDYMLNDPRTAAYMLFDSPTADADLRKFLAIVALAQEAVPESRRVNSHVERESDDWIQVFNFVAILETISLKLLAGFAAGPVAAASPDDTALAYARVLATCISVLETWLAAVPDSFVTLDTLPDPFTALAGPGPYRIIDYDVASAPVSVFYPLHRVFGSFLACALSKTSVSILSTLLCPVDNLPFWLSLAEAPLRVLVLSSQARAGLWVRNGWALRAQLHMYKERSKTLAHVHDISLLQCIALLVGPSILLPPILVRYGILDAFSHIFAKPTTTALGSALASLLGAAGEGWAAAASAKTADWLAPTGAIVADCLELLAVLALDATAADIVRDPAAVLADQIRHELAVQPLAHSKLVKALSAHVRTLFEASVTAPGGDPLDAVIDSVADFHRPSPTKSGVYRLRTDQWARLSPFYTGIATKERASVLENYSLAAAKRKARLPPSPWPQLPSPDSVPRDWLALHTVVASPLVIELVAAVCLAPRAPFQVALNGLHILRIAASALAMDPLVLGADALDLGNEAHLGLLAGVLSRLDGLATAHADVPAVPALIEAVRAAILALSPVQAMLGSTTEGSSAGDDAASASPSASSSPADAAAAKRRERAKRRQAKMMAKFAKKQSAFAAGRATSPPVDAGPLSPSGVGSPGLGDDDNTALTALRTKDPLLDTSDFVCVLCMEAVDDSQPLAMLTLLERSRVLAAATSSTLRHFASSHGPSGQVWPELAAVLDTAASASSGAMYATPRAASPALESELESESDGDDDDGRSGGDEANALADMLAVSAGDLMAGLRERAAEEDPVMADQLMAMLQGMLENAGGAGLFANALTGAAMAAAAGGDVFDDGDSASDSGDDGDMPGLISHNDIARLLDNEEMFAALAGPGPSDSDSDSGERSYPGSDDDDNVGGAGSGGAGGFFDALSGVHGLDADDTGNNLGSPATSEAGNRNDNDGDDDDANDDAMAARNTPHGVPSYMTGDAVTATGCGHCMHSSCFEDFFSSQLAERGRQRMIRSLMVSLEHGEFMCPLCKSLSNALLPLTFLQRPYEALTTTAGAAAEPISAPELTDAEGSALQFFSSRLYLAAHPEADACESPLSPVNAYLAWDALVTTVTMHELALRASPNYNPRAPPHTWLTSFELNHVKSMGALAAVLAATAGVLVPAAAARGAWFDAAGTSPGVVAAAARTASIWALFAHAVEFTPPGADAYRAVLAGAWQMTVAGAAALAARLGLAGPLAEMVTPFLRRAALLQLAYGTGSSGSDGWQAGSDEEAEADVLARNLGLPTMAELATGPPDTLGWLAHFVRDDVAASGKTEECEATSLFDELGLRVELDGTTGLIEPETSFEKLVLSDKACIQCGEVSGERALCLTCGSCLCVAKCEVLADSLASPRPGNCNRHMTQCSGDLGMFLLLRTSEIVALRRVSSGRGPTRGTKLGSIYLDSHGEQDIGLRRGRPLQLSKPLFAQLNRQWIKGEVGILIARDVAAQSRIKIVPWDAY